MAYVTWCVSEYDCLTGERTKGKSWLRSAWQRHICRVAMGQPPQKPTKGLQAHYEALNELGEPATSTIRNTDTSI